MSRAPCGSFGMKSAPHFVPLPMQFGSIMWNLRRANTRVQSVSVRVLSIFNKLRSVRGPPPHVHCVQLGSSILICMHCGFNENLLDWNFGSNKEQCFARAVMHTRYLSLPPRVLLPFTERIAMWHRMNLPRKPLSTITETRLGSRSDPRCIPLEVYFIETSATCILT
jgi:hypothetical protein